RGYLRAELNLTRSGSVFPPFRELVRKHRQQVEERKADAREQKYEEASTTGHAFRQEIENGDDEPRAVRGDGGVAKHRTCLPSLTYRPLACLPLADLLIRHRESGVGLRLVKNPDLHGHCPRELPECLGPAYRGRS